MRAFIAIEIPEYVKEKIIRFRTELKNSNIFIAKWVNSFHLTLKFLGDIEEEHVDEIIKILENICKDTKPFELSIKNLGAFPSENYIQVLWLGIEKGKLEAEDLHAKIDYRLNFMGLKKDEKYHNHITLARVKNISDKINLAKFFERENELGTFQVNSIKLIKSTLTTDGPIYEDIAECKLL